jgi:hypothetical protein
VEWAKMQNKALIFLSHSSKDEVLAGILANQIETEVGSRAEVFASTRPTAIQSGEDWFDKILESLDKAEILVILLTPSAENCVWVGFEFGYFWKKKNRSNVHTLYHPKATIPNPLGIIQAKLITNPEHVRDFLRQLGHSLGVQPGRSNVDALIRSAQALTIPSPERTFRKFGELLDQAEWLHGFIDEKEVWTCEEDVLYQIVITYENGEEFYEEWTRGFPDPTTNRYFVHLDVAGVTIKQISFISLDGGRNFVPMPEIRPLENERRGFYLNKDSFQYKVARLVGRYDHCETLDEFAVMKGIEIVK